MSKDTGPSIDLLRAGGHKVLCKRVEPQPDWVPEGLVLVEMPDNCYLDMHEQSALRSSDSRSR